MIRMGECDEIVLRRALVVEFQTLESYFLILLCLLCITNGQLLWVVDLCTEAKETCYQFSPINPASSEI